MLRTKLKHQDLSNIFHMHALEYTETAAVPVAVSVPYRKRKVKHTITPTAFRRFFLFELDGFKT